MNKLPDIVDDEDDAAFKSRLQPVVDRVVPAARELAERQAGTRKPKRVSIELLLPEHVVDEIKLQAAARKITATTLVLEVLRAADDRVTDADFTDLRRGRRQCRGAPHDRQDSPGSGPAERAGDGLC